MAHRHGPISAESAEFEQQEKLRPRRLAEFVGQFKIVENLRVFMQAAQMRGDTLDHVLLSGPPGLGKCITADSNILTQGGYVPMHRFIPEGMLPGQVRPLEIPLMGWRGLEQTSHIFRSGNGPTLQLTTSAGKRIEGTPHHPLLVHNGSAREWRRLDALQEGDVLIGANEEGGHTRETVSRITNSTADTYDFVVPGTHSFIANGLINHNTTLGHIIAAEMQASIVTTSGPVLDKPAAIAGILTKLSTGDVLFIDEIHRLTPVVEEYLYSAMEDYQMDIVIDSGPNARSVKITLEPFTLVGATTRKGLLTAPLRDRFGIDFRYDYYSADLLRQILIRSSRILNIELDEEGAMEIARRSRGTPRIANRLLRRARDYAQVEGQGRITLATADRALTALEVDQEGLDDMDARILLALIDKFDGGPVGLTNLAVSVGEEAGTIEEVYEPYLILEGYMKRTARGRMANPKAYKHFNRKFTQASHDLFDQPE